MFEEKDYVLRIIHEIVRMLAKILLRVDIDKEEPRLDYETGEKWKRLSGMIDDGEINEAENLLVEGFAAEDNRGFQVALLFYDYLNKKDDAFLAAHDFSREEVADGLKYAISFYGYGDMVDAFMEGQE